MRPPLSSELRRLSNTSPYPSLAVWDIRNLEEKDEIKAVMALNKEDTQNAHRDRVLCLMFKDDILVTGGRYYALPSYYIFECVHAFSILSRRSPQG